MPKLINLLAYDLIDKIIAYIHENQLTPGAKLPSERVMSELFQVNRTTLRGALQKLVDDGTLKAQTNSGYYLTKPKLSKAAGRYFTPDEDRLLKDHHIEVEEMKVPAKDLALLINPLHLTAKYVAAIERIDGEIISLFLLFPVKDTAFSTLSAFALFQQKDYLRSQSITLRTAGPFLAELLQTEKLDSLLMLRETIYKENEIVAEAIGYTISHRCNLQVNARTTFQ
jgi:GntR family transcriptional regulator